MYLSLRSYSFFRGTLLYIPNNQSRNDGAHSLLSGMPVIFFQVFTRIKTTDCTSCYLRLFVYSSDSTWSTSGILMEGNEALFKNFHYHSLTKTSYLFVSWLETGDCLFMGNRVRELCKASILGFPFLWNPPAIGIGEIGKDEISPSIHSPVPLEDRTGCPSNYSTNFLFKPRECSGPFPDLGNVSSPVNDLSNHSLETENETSQKH